MGLLRVVLLAEETMQHQQIVHPHFQGESCTDTHQAAARKAPQAPMFFEIRKDDFNGLTA